MDPIKFPFINISIKSTDVYFEHLAYDRKKNQFQKRLSHKKQVKIYIYIFIKKILVGLDETVQSQNHTFVFLRCRI